jgi:hypothetical protein
MVSSTRRTAGCGPACPVVWEGRTGNRLPYPDLIDICGQRCTVKCAIRLGKAHRLHHGEKLKSMPLRMFDQMARWVYSMIAAPNKMLASTNATRPALNHIDDIGEMCAALLSLSPASARGAIPN